MVVISGTDKGKSGKVTRSLPKQKSVIVEGINIRKKHQRPTRNRQKGQVVDKTFPIHISNVSLVDPKTNKPTRIGYKSEGGKKVRISKKSNSVLS